VLYLCTFFLLLLYSVIFFILISPSFSITIFSLLFLFFALLLCISVFPYYFPASCVFPFYLYTSLCPSLFPLCLLLRMFINSKIRDDCSVVYLFADYFTTLTVASPYSLCC
jgi:hypothetical protein